MTKEFHFFPAFSSGNDHDQMFNKITWQYKLLQNVGFTLDPVVCQQLFGEASHPW